MSDEQPWQVRLYEQKVAAIVTALRDMADSVERAAVPYDKASASGLPRYLSAADRAQNEITWGIANVGMHRLTSFAYDADQFEAGS